MYLDLDNQKAKVGKVNVDLNSNKYRLRWTYPRGNRNQIRLECDWHEAIRIAKLIDRDIELNVVDLTYARYSAKFGQTVKVEKTVKPLNLLDLWETYKSISKDRIAPTTIKRSWIPWEKHFLGKTPAKLLEIDKASEFIAYLLSKYSPGSLDSLFSNCLHPSVNLAVKTGKLDRNPYAAISLAKKSKRQIEAYEPKEVKDIVKAFYNNTYLKKYSRYPHSFYAQMIEFMAFIRAISF